MEGTIIGLIGGMKMRGLAEEPALVRKNENTEATGGNVVAAKGPAMERRSEDTEATCSGPVAEEPVLVKDAEATCNMLWGLGRHKGD